MQVPQKEQEVLIKPHDGQLHPAHTQQVNKCNMLKDVLYKCAEQWQKADAPHFEFLTLFHLLNVSANS